MKGLDPRIDASCRAVPYAPVVVVGVGFHEADVPHPLDGFGYLIPSRERGSVLGVLWPTSTPQIDERLAAYADEIGAEADQVASAAVAAVAALMAPPPPPPILF